MIETVEISNDAAVRTVSPRVALLLSIEDETEHCGISSTSPFFEGWCFFLESF